MPEVPPVMTTVLFSNVYIVGAQGSPNRSVGQLADNMGRFAYAGAVGLFSRGQPLHTGVCATPAELERPFANCKRDGESDIKTVRLAP
jgi:hypothetical protein